MNLLILPDIFGVTPALTALARGLEKNMEASVPDLCTEILNPYGNGTWFKDEAKAYAWFTENLGIAAYAARIARHLDKFPAPRIILAFSAGAAALWRLAGTAPCPGVIGAVGVYASQIRHDTHLAPGFDIHLIFPESEPHFDVADLMAELKAKPNTSCENSKGLHGFMNRFSDHFDEVLYKTFIRESLPNRLTAMTPKNHQALKSGMGTR